MIESIIPGTYIDVRAEGLISAGRIATGVVGVVGTAAKGPVNEAVTLGGFANAREIFSEETEDTSLVRALRLIYGNGASTVIAVRVAGGAKHASFELKGEDQTVTVARLTASTPGSWGNRLAVEVREAGEGCLVTGEDVSASLKLAHSMTETSRNQLRVTRAAENKVVTFNLVPKPAQGTPAGGREVFVSEKGELTFAGEDKPATGDTLTATYLTPKEECVTVALSAPGQPAERYTVADAGMLAGVLNRSSRLATATTDQPAQKPALAPSTLFGQRSSDQAGSDGALAANAPARRTALTSGLEALAEVDVNLVVVAGESADATATELLQGHLRATEAADRERIAVIDVAGASVAELLVDQLSSDRVVLVAPGIPGAERGSEPEPYTAAAVAGLIASLPVQGSLTNQTLVLPGLAFPINRGEQEQLIRHNILTVVAKDGFRIVKGITSAGTGAPFSSIPTRRIVDYARAGVRSASNPYIGRLNNDRVRTALKATLDAFLTGMVEDEALTGYQLEVTATRAQEIAGEVSVSMTLQPVFSIEYIRVVMTLQ